LRRPAAGRIFERHDPVMSSAVTTWWIVGIALGVASIAAIGYFSLGVFRAVKGLALEIGRAGSRLAEAAGPVQEGLAEVGAARGGSSPADR
jgi:hypothetical protein